MQREPKEEIKTAVSFQSEHGIFLSKAVLDKYNLEVGEPVSFYIGDYMMVERCALLGKVEEETFKDEARYLLSILESMYHGGASFLSIYNIAKKLGRIKQTIPTLGDIYPEFRINKRGTFCCLFREVEDVLSEYSKEKSERSKNLENKVNESIEVLSKYMTAYYEDVDCMVGSGAFISKFLSNNLNIAFALQGFNSGGYSAIGERMLYVNPYLLYWLISDITEFKKQSLVFQNNEISELKPVNLRNVKTIKSVKCRSFISTTDIDPGSLRQSEEVQGRIRSVLSFVKPYLFSTDFITPFTSPTLVTFKIEEEKEVGIISSYGDYSVSDHPAKVEKNTEICVDFF